MSPCPVSCCAIYTRQSAPSSDQTLSSCDAQFELCRVFVRSRRHEGWQWIGERLDDVGMSGANTNRPAFQRLMELVCEDKIDHVVIYRLDRLARNLLDCLAALNAFRDAEVQLHIVTAAEKASSGRSGVIPVAVFGPAVER